MIIPQSPIIGRAEKVDLLDLDLQGVPAKIDTGADVSAIWASNIVATENGLDCTFFGEASPFYTGKAMHYPIGEYTVTRIANSFGGSEQRYKIKLRIRVKGKLIIGSFTLSNRATKLYPILIGQRLIRNKFLVNVTDGQALHAEERARAKALKQHSHKDQKGTT